MHESHSNFISEDHRKPSQKSSYGFQIVSLNQIFPCRISSSQIIPVDSIDSQMTIVNQTATNELRENLDVNNFEAPHIEWKNSVPAIRYATDGTRVSLKYRTLIKTIYWPTR